MGPGDVAEDHGMSYCKCGQKMRWALTTGKHNRIPLNYQPDPAGNVVLEQRGDLTVAVTLGPMDLELRDPDEPRYMPHHATCPNAEDFK